jgi:hypothetical protein
MKTNSFVISWNTQGVTAIISTSRYSDWPVRNALRILQGLKPMQCPLDLILHNLQQRAQHKPDLYYEIYSIDSDTSFTAATWSKQWHSDPAAAAQFVRTNGTHIWGYPQGAHCHNLLAQ